ncbi:hypothetical protein N9M39_00195 [Halieaceae bacterium]|nr:hypothetical protein [Halieaceae bacterium]
MHPMFSRLVAALAFTVALPVLAEEGHGMETDWLEFVKGYKGGVVGAEVREAQPGSPGKGSTLMIAIPKAAMADPSQIEEVRVVGQAPQELDLLPEFEYEWVDDYDNDFYGLLIRFREDSQMPIRLYLHSDTGFIR